MKIITILLALNVYAEEPVPERQAELLYLLKHDCGACHGMTLKGGLGPPLLPEILATKPKELLFNTIFYGRMETAMPPWRDFLTTEEINWLLKQLLDGIDEH